MKKFIPILFCFLVSVVANAQWNANPSQNNRISNGTMHTFAFGAVSDGVGSVLMVWAERVGNESVMYAQRFNNNGSTFFAKKRIFSYNNETTSDCAVNAFTGVALFRQIGSDNIIVLYSLKTGSAAATISYLQYQIISWADGTPKIPEMNGNLNRGLNLGYNDGDISFDAKDIVNGGNKIIVAWHQKNSTSDANRGGRGNTANGADIRIAVIDPTRTNITANDITSIPYLIDGASGEQTNPRVFAIESRIFVAFRSNVINAAVNQVTVKKYTFNGTTVAAGNGTWNANLASTIDNMDAGDRDLLQIQPKTIETGEMTVYSRLEKDIYAHRFNPQTGSYIGKNVIITKDNIGGIAIGGGYSENTCFIYTKSNKQMIRLYGGNVATSAETPITQRTHSGDPTFNAVRISNNPERYMLSGENRDTGEIYGQVIRFDNAASEGVREWGDNGKIVSNAVGSKSGPRPYSINTSANTWANLFLWKDQRNGSGCQGDLYAQLLDIAGNPVNIPASLTFVDVMPTTIVRGQQGQVSFATTGVFNAGNEFRINIWSTGGVVANIAGSGTSSPITFTVPATLAPNTYYVEIASTNPIVRDSPPRVPQTKGSFVVTAAPSVTVSKPTPSKTALCVDENFTATASVSGLLPGAAYTVTAQLWNQAGTTQIPITSSTEAATSNVSGMGTFTINNIKIPAAVADGSYTLKVLLKSGTPSQEYTSVLSDVVTLLRTPTVTAAANPSTVCAGATVNLTATAGATTYLWSGTALANANQQSTTAIPTATSDYTVKASNACGTAPDGKVTVTVKVAAAPALNALNYCTGQAPMSLTASVTANNNNLKWYDVATGGTALSAAPAPPTASRSYWVSQSVDNCESLRLELKITVTSTPTISATANGTATSLSLCAGEQLELKASAGFTTYTWTGSTVAAPSQANQTPIAATTANSGTYKITANGACGMAESSVTVTVKAKPAAPATTASVALSVNQVATALTATAVSGATLRWWDVATGGAALPNAPTPVTTAPSSKNYWVSQVLDGCESDRAAIVVTVSDKPITGVTNATATPASVCPGKETTVAFEIQPADGVGVFNVFLVNASNQKIGNSLGTGTKSPIKVTFPANTPAATTYRLLVEASGTISVTTGNITIRPLPSVQLVSPLTDVSVVKRTTGNNLIVQLDIKGEFPITVDYSFAGQVRSQPFAASDPATIGLNAANEGVFRITGIKNECGNGTIVGVQNFNVALKRVVAVEDDPLITTDDWARVYPNPVGNLLSIEIPDFKPSKKTTLRVFDLNGKIVQERPITESKTQINVEAWKDGFYLLHLQAGEQKAVLKILKR